ncbi:ATP-dependent zinc metalloprotease FtsH [Polyangium sp. 6x1]|uniref:ATP-dependent zinc metalloprotease FtsH n=1 Tax=Polyangium sp. 6x1 TaxID=3042689 RepID=UPI0024830A12|nr:ATP-dependent zinc metalloprotease FtsH [Polyangium sp. 6x1]MDI1442946.1 ATP-dependent zinc metalloprotease FtsH [Polyangium sp. 6x1]
MPEVNPKPRAWSWLFYAFLIFAALAFSGVFGPTGARTVPYDEAVRLVEQGRVESASITADDVVLRLKPEGPPPAETSKKPSLLPTPPPKGEEVRTGRIPGVEQEPLVSALLTKDVAVDAQPSRTPFWVMALWWIVPLVAINLLFFAAFRRGAGGGVGGPLGLTRAKTRLYDRAAREPVHFSDVAGVDEAKDELVEVVDFLKRPARYRALGGRIPRGILLVGPPGTGKTLLARAVAGEAEVPFFSLNASEFVEMFVGLGAARVRDLFNEARKSAPCIVFIDEIDAVGRSRGGLGALATHDEREQTLQQLLAELDGFDPRATVILMAATNRPEVLDPALLRPGRFDRQVIVDRPDLAGREAILAVHGRRLPLGSDVNLGAVARRTPGMAGADLANIVNEAALAAARRSGTEITQADFEDALDRVQLGLRRRGIMMTPGERRRVAVHESGHALVALALPEADPVERVSIVARAVSLGVTIQVPRDERHVLTETELEARVMVLLGGRAAEELCDGSPSTGAHDDLGRATAIVREMITRFGMSRRLGLPALTRNVGAPLLGLTQEERLCSDETAREIDEEVRDRLAELFGRARALLEGQRAGLQAAAEALLERETLTGAELKRVADEATARERAGAA